MQFLHIVASNILRASSRVGEERCNKALRTLYKREAPSRLDSADVQENAGARTHPLPPSPCASDQGDSWNRAYSPQVS